MDVMSLEREELYLVHAIFSFLLCTSKLILPIYAAYMYVCILINAAYGLKLQCEKVVKQIDALVSRGINVQVNACGLSRGGIAVMYLCQMLSKYPSHTVSVYALLFDPVPGNFITSSTLDVFHFTTANKGNCIFLLALCCS
jgi:hypothetical protein